MVLPKKSKWRLLDKGLRPLFVQQRSQDFNPGDSFMKKPLVHAVASLAGCCLLAPAFAQGTSVVNLYGIMDNGVTRIDNLGGANSLQLRSGNLLTSRFGLRGSEDLGGGLKANFNLEAGITADTGATSSPFFNRQSWVGLSSASFGDITLGRVLPTISDVFVLSMQASYLGNTAAAMDGGAQGAGSSVARFNNMIGGTRVDNTIKYQSPSFSGFKLHAMASLGEVPGSSSAGRMLSAAASYSSENIEAGLAYHERQCTEAAGCGAGKAKDQIVGLGAAYKLNGARYAMYYTRQENALNVQGNNADVLSLMAQVPVGAWLLGGGLQFQNDRTALNQDARQLNLAAKYLLSKRTQLYAIYAHQSVKNGGKAGMYSVTSGSGTQNQLSAGIMHVF